MPAYGLSAAGFAVKPLSVILQEMQDEVLGVYGQDYDLSPETPDGQFLGIIANAHASLWDLLQVLYGTYDRQDAEGAALDNLGDLVGIPRAGTSYTQVYADLSLDAAHAPYAAGTLQANVTGNATLSFTNLSTVTAAMISGGVAAGVLMQAQTAGPTPSINPGTLTVITAPVTGWTAVTNPEAQSQTGQSVELDELYAPRQSLELAAEGAANPSATVAAIIKLGEAQQPPVQLTATVLENTEYFAQVIGGVGIPPRSYAVFVWDGVGAPSGFASTSAGQQAIGQVLWNNKPAGITMIGSTHVVVQDPVLGQVPAAYTVPVGRTLYIKSTVAPRIGVDWTALSAAIKSALVAAAIAPTPATGIPPMGKLAPGDYVVGSQLEGVIAAVPGVLDVQVLTFGFAPSPTNTGPLSVGAFQVATVAAVNITLIQGVGP